MPELKIAFELNGIFHYEPIYGVDKFERIKENDKQKFIECYKQGIELVVIDCSTMVYFKEYNTIKYLDIITEIIDRNIKRACPVELEST